MTKKWQQKNPRQAVILATDIQKELGIYEELRGETNPEKIQKRAMQRMLEMDDKEKEKYGKKIKVILLPVTFLLIRNDMKIFFRLLN